MDETLLDIRSAIGVTQEQMASLMGVPLRTYEDLEKGRAKTRPVHIRAARYGAIVHAINAEDGSMLPTAIRDDIIGAYNAIQHPRDYSPYETLLRAMLGIDGR